MPLFPGEASLKGALEDRPPEEGELLAVMRSPELLSRVQDGLRRIGAAPARAVAPAEALARLVGPGRRPMGLLCEPQPDESGWEALQAVARDPFSPVRHLLLGSGGTMDDPAALLMALRVLTGRHAPGEADEVEALRRGLAEDEVAMRYQPIVRLSDRRPVGVEGLVRWLRPDGPQGMTPVGPDCFVPIAERGGLAPDLAWAVGRMAAAEMRAVRPLLALPVFINLPLEMVLRRDAAPWLSRLCRQERLQPAELGVELTETTPVPDLPALSRAVTRLRWAGHPVWIDDMGLDENRDALLDLPFSGIKLDRSLVEAIPRRRRARAKLERLVALARSRSMLVTAEGVTGGALWRAMAMAGVDHAQGFAVGRPLPAAALPAWAAAWRQAQGPAGA